VRWRGWRAGGYVIPLRLYVRLLDIGVGVHVGSFVSLYACVCALD